MDPSVSAPAGESSPAAPPASGPVAPRRSAADRRMRRLLRLPEDDPRDSLLGAQNAFSKSVFISAVRCLFTYLFVPLLGPVVGLRGDVGPIVGLTVGAISVLAIVYATRRLFRADHRWRWRYAGIASGILVLLSAQAVIDIVHLAT